MQVFLRRMVLFWLPVGLLLAGIEAFLWCSGEMKPLPLVAREQQELLRAGRESLCGRRFVEGLQPFKLASLLQRDPSVAALGSSTTMPFRRCLFQGRGVSFYNAGGLIQRAADLTDFEDLLDRLPRLRVVVLGLDLWWFNAASASNDAPRLRTEISSKDPFLDWRAHLFAIQSLGRGVIETPGLLRRGWAPRSPVDGEVGFGLGTLHGDGFRGSDGSWQYGDFVLRSRRQVRYVDDEQVVERVQRGNRRFEPGRVPDPRALDALRGFIGACRDRDVLVAGFTSPLAGEVVDALLRSPRHRELFRAYRRAMRTLFAKRDLPFVDASDPRELGLSDRYMVNGLHGSEVLMGHILLRLSAHPGLAAALPGFDRPRLLALLRSPRTTPALFGRAATRLPG